MPLENPPNLSSTTQLSSSSLSDFPLDYGSFRYRKRLGALQLGILLHQLFQAEARKLYSNLGFFAFSFALIDGTLAVFGMADALARAESALAGGFFRSGFRDGEFFAAAGEKLGDVLDGIVGLGGGGNFLASCSDTAAPPSCALVFVLVGIMNIGIVGCGASPR